jgi:hypothetical protein
MAGRYADSISKELAMYDENDDEDFDDFERFLLSCDICGQEEDEEDVDEHWISFCKPSAPVEVLVCVECTKLPEKPGEGVQDVCGGFG